MILFLMFFHGMKSVRSMRKFSENKLNYTSYLRKKFFNFAIQTNY